MKVTLLTESDLRKCVEMDLGAVAAIEDGFGSFARGEALIPPIMRVGIEEHHGEVDVKTAYIRGRDRFAVKIASGFFANRRLGLPSGSGLMVVLSAQTGFPQAVLLDNGYLTNVRTGAAGAVAAKYLAPAVVETVGVVGSGTQARYQINALRLVRDFERLLVCGRSPDSVSRYADEMRGELGVKVAAADAETLVRESDVVVTTTPSRQPILEGDWVHPGLHITAVGSDAEEKQELAVEVLARADRLVCDLKSQCFRLGELHHGLEEGVVSRDSDIVELGELVIGRRIGRASDEEITVCDLTGVGVQDTAIALLACRLAADQDLGMQVTL